MKIKEIKENKKQFLPLLLLADEQEDMINRYLDKGTMYVLDDDGVKCECVVTDEGNGILEIKNIATEPEYQGKGYGKHSLTLLLRHTKENIPHYKLAQGIVRRQSLFMRSVDLFVRIALKTSSRIIMTIQYMKQVLN